MPRKAAIGLQDFEKIITRNCLYVDKTDFISRKLTDADMEFFKKVSKKESQRNEYESMDLRFGERKC